MSVKLGWRAVLVLCGAIHWAPATAESLPPLRDVSDVGLGSDFTCALNTQGVARCWGSNEFGQLGISEGVLSDRPTPVPVASAGRGLSGLAVGYFHTCAITPGGAVKCWGRDLFGALGDGPEDDGPTADDVIGLTGSVTALSAGAVHSCALLASGAVQCWGYNSSGQLGDGTFVEERPSAVAVVGLGGAATKVEAGDAHTCAILANGSVSCWGLNDSGQLGDGTTTKRAQPVPVQGLPGPARALAASARATCALTTTGAVYCWGAEYPLGAFEGGSLVARLYPGFESGFIGIDAGVFHFCALSTSRAVKCFGDGFLGQFGTGPIDGSLGADSAVGLAPGIEQVAAGGHHTCARSAAGGLQCWGLNTSGQLGIDKTTRRLVPTPVVGLGSGVRGIATGGTHSCALTVGEGVKCWGSNNQDTIGDGTRFVRLTAVDVVGRTSGVRALALGTDHSCLIDLQGRVFCWGANYDGRLGNGESINSGLPVEVRGLGGVAAVDIAVGDAHGCALLDSGVVKCWGRNHFGQIGDGTRQDRLNAVDVVGLGNGVRAISAGYFHSCAVTAARGLKCWGENTSGQLGDGSNTHRDAPVDVVGLSSGVVAVASGDQHGCAIVTGGGVKCWGFHFFGLVLGDESTVDRNVPGDVPTLRTGVVELALGAYVTCARLLGGAVKCWGVNPIGDNTELARGTPTAVAGLERGVTDIDAGFGGHICVVVSGAAKCWGSNTGGQLGDGTTHGEPVPRVVVSDEFERRVAPVSAQGNDESRASSSDASGRFVVFQSDASNLVPGDSNGRSDVFRFDRETRETLRVSLDDGEAQITGDAIEPRVSANGEFIVFVAPDAAVAKIRGESKRQGEARRKGSSSGVYLRNLVSGSTQRMGTAMTSASGTTPTIAPAATAVAFTSDVPPASGGVAGKPNIYYVPLTPDGDNLNPGATICVSCKSLGANGAPGADADGESSHAALSADGKQIAYETTSKNALSASPSPCPGTSSEIMLHNLVVGATQRMSPPASTPVASCGSEGSTAPSIDYAGDTLAFQSDTALQSSDGNGTDDIYVIQTVAPTTPILISDSVGGIEANGASTTPSLSGDGMSIAFISSAQNLDLSFADNNDRADVHTASVGLEGQVARLSRGPSGAESDASSERPALNYDGTRVAFDSAAQTLATGAGGEITIYQRDNPLVTPVRSATWWKSTENGWGLTVFDQGNVLAPAWFTYDTDGEPTWFLTAGAFLESDGRYRGDLLRLTGTPFDRIEGPAVVSATGIGNATLRFEGDESLEFAYNALGVQQTKLLTRFPFGSRTFACTASPQAARDGAENFSDIWSGAGENAGWGLTMFHVDDSLFAGWYTYDADGEAVFFVIATSRQADGSFAGPIFRQRNGVPFSQIADAAASAGSDAIGDATFRFSDGDSGTFSYRVGAVNQSKAIVRLVVGSRTSVCASADGPVQ